MQSKQMSISNPRNRWALALVPLAAVLALIPATRLFAGTTALAPAARSQLVSADPMALRAADADKDVGPGGAESMLAQHPDVSR